MMVGLLMMLEGTLSSQSCIAGTSANESESRQHAQRPRATQAAIMQLTMHTYVQISQQHMWYASVAGRQSDTAGNDGRL